MKKIKIFLFFVLATLILNNCGTVQDAMDPQRKNNTDEFLVEKKSPLSMPPDFIDFHVGNFHWFIFNVADIFITIGIFLMIMIELVNKDQKI